MSTTTDKPTRSAGPPSEAQVQADIQEALSHANGAKTPAMTGNEYRESTQRAEEKHREEMRQRGRDAAGLPLSRRESEPAEPEPQDEFSASVADAEAKLVALQQQLKRAAPELLANPDDVKVAAEVSDIHSEIEACQRVIELVPLARDERERRQAQEAEQAEVKRLAAARERVVKVRSERDAAASEADAAIAKAAKVAAVFAEKQSALDVAEVAADERSVARGAVEQGALILAATHWHLREAGVVVNRRPVRELPDRPLAGR